MRRTDFDFTLPPELIAQRPPERRGDARLLIVPPTHADEGSAPPFQDALIRDFPAQLRAGDLLVFNDTRVIPARLFGEKETGGQVEVMVERLLDSRELLAQVRASKAPKTGMRIRLKVADDPRPVASLEVIGREGEFYRLRLETSQVAPNNSEPALLAVLDRCGHIPLPPYIERADEAEDRNHYQTLFAREPGAVAAPTAGLHFDEALIQAIRARGVRIETATLHVGAGTFQPMRVEDLSEHRMHAERYTISPTLAQAVADTKTAGGRVVAIGTTSVRALESAALDGQLNAGSGETRLFITPGYQFQIVDALLTNFHLPQSTLLMLVCAFAGHTRVLDAYAHAVREGYRFFSYGDAMWLAGRTT